MESWIQYREPRLQDCLGLHYMKQTLLAAKWFFSPRQNHFLRKPRMDTVPALPANPHVFTKTAGHRIWFWSFSSTHGDVSLHGITRVNPTWRRKSRQLKMVSQTVASSSVTANWFLRALWQRYKAALSKYEVTGHFRVARGVARIFP